MFYLGQKYKLQQTPRVLVWRSIEFIGQGMPSIRFLNGTHKEITQSFFPSENVAATLSYRRGDLGIAVYDQM